jgi:hypothetical protein
MCGIKECETQLFAINNRASNRAVASSGDGPAGDFHVGTIVASLGANANLLIARQ